MTLNYFKHSFRILFLASAALVQGAQLIGNNNSSTTFKQVEDLYLKSFAFEQQEKITSNQELEKQNQKLVLQIKQLSEGEKRKIAFDLFSKNFKLPQDLTQLDATFIKKMEIFCGGEQPQAHLFNIINKTQTVFGEAALAAIVSHPTHNEKILKDRQNSIQVLLEDKKLCNEIETFLNQIKESEQSVLSYWQEEHPANHELYKRVYFGDWLGFLNQNTVVLESTVRLRNLLTAFVIGCLPGYAVGIPAFVSYTKAQALEQPITKFQAFNNGVTFWDPRLQAYKDHSYSELNPTTPQTIGDTVHMVANLPIPTKDKAAIAGAVAFYVGLSLIGAYAGYNEASLQNDIAKHLQTKLIGVESCLSAIRKLYYLIENQEALKNITAFADMHRAFEHNGKLSNKAQKLVSLLNHNTFNGNASFFSITGRVLAAHKLMEEIKDELAPAFCALGYIDAYLSIAKLYAQHEDKRVSYSFVTFVESDAPFVDARNFWNPFVDTKTVVANNIQLNGQDTASNMILTGPNTGGKSTIIKGLLLNLLFAQTFGIAPAESLVISPFTYINCYLNITDDIAAGTSLFKAEVLRAKKLIETIRSLKNGEFSFTIMDEVFSGTSPKEGEEAAYLFAKELGLFQNSLCCIATHFPKLTDLENENAPFKNYQVTVKKAEDGSWIRPFKLEEGKSTINIAFDLLKEEGIFS
jgi:hypothetical protein